MSYLRDLTKKNKRNIYFLLIPSITILVLTFIIPTFWALILSFTDFKLGHKKEFIGLMNYVKIFRESPDFWSSVTKTLIFTVLMVTGEFLVGFGISLLLSRKFHFQKLLVTIVIAPLAVSPVVAIIIWRFLLFPNFGTINYLISLVNIAEPDWFTNKYLVYVIITIIDVWISSPFVFIMIYPAIISIDPNIIEASTVDGAKWHHRLIYITLPSIKQVAITAVIFRIIFALRLFENIWLFSKGGPAGSTKVLSIYLYEQTFSYWNFGTGSAIAWILLVITMIFVIPQMKVLLRSYRS